MLPNRTAVIRRDVCFREHQTTAQGRFETATVALRPANTRRSRHAEAVDIHVGLGRRVWQRH